MAKYLLVYRNASTTPDAPPSPEEMQKMLAGWQAWKAKFNKEIVDLGDGLKREGKVISAAGITDGPLVESKELVGGYSVVEAASLADATVVAQACPILHVPGARIEVREMMGF